MGRENRNAGPYDLPAEPELSDLLRAVLRNLKLTIRTHCTATIVSYDPARQKCILLVGTLPVVKVTDPTKIPTTMVALKGVPPNAEATLAPIQLVEIPVAWPRTNSGYVTFPLLPGDTGELHIQDRSLEAWMLLGASTDPVFAFTHALKDSVFHPGLHPDTNPIVPPTDLTATVVDGLTAIKIGALAVSAITKAEELILAMDGAIAAAVLAAVPIIPPNLGDGGTAAFTAFKGSWDTAKLTIKAVKGKVF